MSKYSALLGRKRCQYQQKQQTGSDQNRWKLRSFSKKNKRKTHSEKNQFK